MARIAFLVGERFEDDELRTPRLGLTRAGHDVVIVGVSRGKALHGKRGEVSVDVEVAAGTADPRAFDALVIPGGRSPAHLVGDPGVIDFVRAFAHSGRPIAAVCHGPQLLAAAGLVAGKRLTSWPAIRAELEAAGAAWTNSAVVRDGALITSRKPGDLAAFTEAILEVLAPAVPA